MAFDKNEIRQLKDLFIEQDKQIDRKIEDFALIVKKGFDGVDKRFDGVDKRFDGADKRLDNHEKRFIRMERSLSNLEFIATEIVRRDEFLALKQEVELLKSKIAIS